METFKLNPSLLQAIKKQIDTYATKEKKPQGYSEILGYFAKGFITKGQAHKIKSFYENYSVSELEKQDKKRLYDAINILPFCLQSLEQFKRVQATTNKAHNTAKVHTTRTVDRLTKPTLADVRPPKLDSNPMAVNESVELAQERARIIEIINRNTRL
jgi:phosphomevalonate kinase